MTAQTSVAATFFVVLCLSFGSLASDSQSDVKVLSLTEDATAGREVRSALAQCMGSNFRPFSSQLPCSYEIRMVCLWGA